MRIDNIFQKQEKIEEKKLGIAQTKEAIKDRLISNLLLFGKTFYSDKKDKKGRTIGVMVSFNEASNYASKDGFVISMPEIIAVRIKLERTHELWQNWYITHSEENIGIDKKGLWVKKAEPVLVVVHGGGILTHRRIEQSYREEINNYNGGVCGDGSVRYTESEFNNLLKGEIAHEETVKLYTLDDLKKGASIVEHRFGVIMPYELAQSTKSGWHTKKEFLNNPLVIVRAGGVENLESYFDKINKNIDSLRDRKIGNWCRSIKTLDPAYTRGHFLDVSGESGGFDEYFHMFCYDSRFFAVAKNP